MQNGSRDKSEAAGQNYQERACIKSVKKNGCSDSFNFLVKEHSAIFYKIYSRYSNLMFYYGYDKNDIESDKNYVFFSSVSSYRFDKKSKFSTWLANQTRFFCLNFINKQKKTIQSQKNVLSKNNSVEVNDKIEIFYNYENKIDVENALNRIKDKRIKDIFKYRYFNGKMPWSTISEKINSSIQTVHNLHAEGKRMLKKSLTK